MLGVWTAGQHFCGIAHQGLLDAGHEPELVRSFGSRRLPDVPFNLSRGRRAVRRATGSGVVPALVLGDGTVVHGTAEILAWAKGHPRLP